PESLPRYATAVTPLSRALRASSPQGEPLRNPPYQRLISSRNSHPIAAPTENRSGRLAAGAAFAISCPPPEGLFRHRLRKRSPIGGTDREDHSSGRQRQGGLGSCPGLHAHATQEPGKRRQIGDDRRGARPKLL